MGKLAARAGIQHEHEAVRVRPADPEKGGKQGGRQRRYIS